MHTVNFTDPTNSRITVKKGTSDIVRIVTRAGVIDIRIGVNDADGNEVMIVEVDLDDGWSMPDHDGVKGMVCRCVKAEVLE